MPPLMVSLRTQQAHDGGQHEDRPAGHQVKGGVETGGSGQRDGPPGEQDDADHAHEDCRGAGRIGESDPGPARAGQEHRLLGEHDRAHPCGQTQGYEHDEEVLHPPTIGVGLSTNPR